MRHHALLVRRARWTNAVHSSSFVVCVRIFVHAKTVRGARRMNVHARRTPAMRRARWTNARYTRGTRGVHAGHALCVRRLRSSAHIAHCERTPSVLLTHVQRAQRSSGMFLTCAWRAHSVAMGYINAYLPIPSSLLDRPSWQCFMQDQNVACRRTCARPSRNLASTRGDGKCRVDAHETHICLYNMTIT